MHGLSAARNLIDAAKTTAAGRGLVRVTKLVVSVGEVFEVDAREVRLCFNLLKKGDPVMGSCRLTIEPRAARFCCDSCGQTFGLESSGRCPGCGSSRISLVDGNEILLLSVEGE